MVPLWHKHVLSRAHTLISDIMQVITKSLSPIWNETFVFPAAEVKAALESSSIISFEVWDSDTLSDDFLGQVGTGAFTTATSAVLQPRLGLQQEACRHTLAGVFHIHVLML